MPWVQLLTHMVGRRGDGREWPPFKGTIEVGEGEAEQLVYGEWGRLVAGPEAEPEEAQEPEEEPEEHPEAWDDNELGTAPDDDFEYDQPAAPAPPSEPEKPAVYAAKPDWVAYAVNRGLDKSLAASMTQQQLITMCE